MGLDTLAEMAERFSETEMLEKLVHFVVHRRQPEFFGQCRAQFRAIAFIKRNHIATRQSANETNFGFLHGFRPHLLDRLADNCFRQDMLPSSVSTRSAGRCTTIRPSMSSFFDTLMAVLEVISFSRPRRSTMWLNDA
jgi:hypothetical protein